MKPVVRRAADENLPVAELAKSFGMPPDRPKVWATFATAGMNLSAARLRLCLKTVATLARAWSVKRQLFATSGPSTVWRPWLPGRVPPAARLSTWGALLALMVLTVVFAPATVAQERVRLECTPRTFRVVPGEPMRLELTVRADSAASIRLHVPGDPLLKLRALEKLPVRRTPEGVIVHKRVVVWQALEPGLVKIDRLSVETKGRKLLFPEVTITVRDPGP